MRTAGRWPPLIDTSPTPPSLRDLLRQLLVGQRLDVGQLQGLGGQGDGHDRRVGRVDLGIDRRGRQGCGQQGVRRVDRRLDLLLGDVEAEVQVELQGDYRGAAGADRRHPVEVRHLAELDFEGRGHGGRHHLRARARIEGLHLNGRVVDFRQRRKRQETEPHEPTIRIAAMNSDVATGRSMKGREGLIRSAALAAASFAARRSAAVPMMMMLAARATGAAEMCAG